MQSGEGVENVDLPNFDAESKSAKISNSLCGWGRDHYTLKYFYKINALKIVDCIIIHRSKR